MRDQPVFGDHALGHARGQEAGLPGGGGQCEANRYSVPFALIGKTVQVVREGGRWVIRYRGSVVAEHTVLAGKAQLSVHPEHGPGAAARNTRQRFATASALLHARDPAREVEVRDLAVYEQLFASNLAEAARARPRAAPL